MIILAKILLLNILISQFGLRRVNYFQQKFEAIIPDATLSVSIKRQFNGDTDTEDVAVKAGITPIDMLLNIDDLEELLDCQAKFMKVLKMNSAQKAVKAVINANKKAYVAEALLEEGKKKTKGKIQLEASIERIRFMLIHQKAKVPYPMCKVWLVGISASGLIENNLDKSEKTFNGGIKEICCELNQEVDKEDKRFISYIAEKKALSIM